MTDELGTVLDTDRLAVLADEIGDVGLVRQAVQTFVDEVPQRLADIRVALAGKDDAEIRSTAHALGSPAAMLGAVAVSASSKVLQAAALEGRTEEYAAMAADLEATTHRTVDAIRDYLAS